MSTAEGIAIGVLILVCGVILGYLTCVRVSVRRKRHRLQREPMWFNYGYEIKVKETTTRTPKDDGDKTIWDPPSS